MIFSSLPNLAIENSIGGLVCGIDEAGRGPLAGPVVAACVILDYDHIPAGLNDSKKLSASKREVIYLQLLQTARIGIGFGSLRDIAAHNILGATMLAMNRAIGRLPIIPNMALVDGNQLPDLPCNGMAVIGGDGKSLSIAAASVIAKVTRDRIMQKLARKYTGYGWAKNSGYGTAEHMQGIAERGITPHHRRDFAPVREYLESTKVL